ncbi:Nsp1-like C-terminal region-domain-containing protein [Schizophyllum amplum]|uniref:Nucleoporin NSP1 n=1 Tax=Schizophyllum amplum TaxID=97359 RepID=A0A550CT36_9AGAR|nr:Nsp1-like C-terminal region-domain-containing protein [Auriculariopsis ampla]
MLRGKTIEEIVNKWSADLDTHVREFKTFAHEVQAWDRSLIENSNNLAALYSNVLKAEREQQEIDRSLDSVETRQKELSQVLDEYEKNLDGLLGQGAGYHAMNAGPADTERDKNYTLATELFTHLDDMSSSLGQMIEAVNGLSVSEPDGEAAENPMNAIQQILSSHLESLQWIDGAVRDVEGKVTEVERRIKDSGTEFPSSNGRSRSSGLR